MYRNVLTSLLGLDDVRAAERAHGVVPFIPIAVAVFGLGVFLVGGVRADDPGPGLETARTLDFVVTGSITAPRDLRHDLEMLDR